MITFFASLLGCENSDLAQQIDKIDFQIAILGEDQHEANVFGSDEDIRLALRLINNSEDAIEWHHDYICQMYQTQFFLSVFKLNESDETSESYLPIGTPYQSPVNCYTINFPHILIQPGESILLNLPWSNNPKNQPLSAGKYYTIANFGLNIGGKTKNWELRNDFEIR